MFLGQTSSSLECAIRAREHDYKVNGVNWQEYNTMTGGEGNCFALIKSTYIADETPAFKSCIFKGIFHSTIYWENVLFFIIMIINSSKRRIKIYFLLLDRTNDLDWCCLILDYYSDMVPLEDWGSFNSTNGRSEWKQRNCNNLVGGKNKHQCSGDYFVKDKNRKLSFYLISERT